ncbi:MAG: FTR1 family protein [Solirubrobacteraceae bacterium]|nr:FTR1 family protein [Solirubrobacteraceae bacterium]
MRQGLRQLLAAFALLVIAALAAATPAGAASSRPWHDAEQVRSGLFEAQSDLTLDDTAGARQEAERARALARKAFGAVAKGDAESRLTGALDDAVAAAGRGDAEQLAVARGTVLAALFQTSARITISAAERGDAAATKRWLGLRDFRTATRFSRPGVDATAAARRLRDGEIDANAATLAITKDLLDGYQSRLRELLDDATASTRRKFTAAAAEPAAQAAGYFEILSARYTEDRGADATRTARAAFTALITAAEAGNADDLAAARARIDEALEGFTAAPFTPEEQARRANQLTRFVSLVPIEWRSGTKGTRVTAAFEIQEARAFMDGALAAFADLYDPMRKQNERVTLAAKADMTKLDAVVTEAREGGKVMETGDVKVLADRIVSELNKSFPKAWKEASDDSEFDLIQISLDRMESSVAAGQYTTAEQARLEAYAFFEFGPELRLNPFDPRLAVGIEGLIWFGDSGTPGLANLIAQRAPIAKVRETRAVLDTSLEDAKATLGDGASEATVVTNAAVLVFREGLEAVLILAAITASLRGAAAKRKRPIFIGAFFGLIASAITWVIATFVLEQFSQYGEKLEAIVGIVAIGVLLLVMNWFFHKVYWTSWIAGFNAKKRELIAEEESGARVGFWSAQVFGFGMLGLTSVYREGFETVLFVQSLQLSSGTATVLKGVGLGLFLVGLVAWVTFKAQTKLPYKRMLWVTGILLGVILTILVGQTTRTFQGIGWLSVHPITGIDIPYWAGTWLGIFPSVETMIAQFIAAAFVIGSYYAAEYVKIKRPQKIARQAREAKERAQAQAGAATGDRGPSDAAGDQVAGEPAEPGRTPTNV